MTITHIFFDLHGVLADPAKVHDCYSAGVGRVMAARYGGTIAAWAEANRLIVADWYSYFVDLDLEGDNGFADMWEGWFRTTRALFRLTNTPEPPKDELLALTRELPGLAVEGCQALYPEVIFVLEQVRAAGYIVGAASNAILPQLSATLHGGGILDFFQRPLLMAADVAEQWAKDEQYYSIAAVRAGVPASQCLVVDDNLSPLRGARAIGMRTAWVNRRNSDEQPPVDIIFRDDLLELPRWLSTQ